MSKKRIEKGVLVFVTFPNDGGANIYSASEKKDLYDLIKSAERKGATVSVTEVIRKKSQKK